MRVRSSLLLIAMCAGGCADVELERAATRPADAVQLSSREPGPACRALACVEVRSGRDDEPSSEALRAWAVEHGANYVVLDTFRVFDETDDRAVLTRARLFACPLPAYVTE